MTAPALLGPRRPLLLLGGATAVGLAGTVCGLLAALAGPFAPAALVIGAAFLVVSVVRPAWALALALTLSPFESLQLPLGPGALSPTEGALLVVAAGWAVRAVAGTGRTVWPSWADAPVIALVLLVPPGLLWGAAPADVVKTTLMWTAFYLAFLVAKSLDARDLRLVLLALVVGAGVLGGQGVLAYVSGGGAVLSDGGAQVSGRASSGITDPNYYAAYLTLAAVPALGLAVGLRGWRGRPVAAVAGAVCCAGVVLSLSRGSILALVLALTLLLAGWSRSRRTTVAALLALLVVLAVNAGPLLQSGVYRTVSERLSTVTQTQSSQNNRLLLWKASLRIVQAHPQGVGVFRFDHHAGLLGITERGRPLGHAHNVFFNLMVELGLPGFGVFVLWLGVIAWTLLRALRRRQPATFPYAVGLSAALVGWTFNALTVTLYQVQIIFATFFVLAGAAAALSSWSDDGTRADRAAQAAVSGSRTAS